MFGMPLDRVTPLNFAAGRNKDLREVSLEVDGQVSLRFA